MTEERLFRSVIKVVTKSYGISNDPAAAHGTYAVANYAPKEACILLLRDSRFVTTGNLTFLVGIPETNYGGVTYPMYPDTDMNPRTMPDAEVWLNSRDVIAIIEES